MLAFLTVLSVSTINCAGHSLTNNLFKYDQSVFVKNYYSDEAKLIFHTHQIEKGLSHIEFRAGFGLKTLVDLRNVMNKIKDRDSVEYVNALAALKEYFNVHKNFDTSKQKRILGEEIVKMVEKTKSDIGGSKVIWKESKENNRNTSFEQLMQNRHSVREYSEIPVVEKDVVEAIKIAQRTPTVCNRQSPRVLLIQDWRMIKNALKLQGGMSGYKTPPYLLLVTVENKAYLNMNERHQGYIDGGLFTMSLLLALEYKSLAAVPLHTMFNKNTDVATRKLLKIPKSESLIAYISIGNFRKKNKVAKSFRYPVERITRRAPKLQK